MKETPIKEINSLRAAIERSFAKLDPHSALTSLAVECRDFRTVESRKGFLCGPYRAHEGAPRHLDGKPRFAALASLNVLRRGVQELNKPLRDVLKTAGSREDADEQLTRVRFFDILKAFTVKQSEVAQFLATRFDGCEHPSRGLVDSISAEMKREAFETRAGVFEMVSPSIDRYCDTAIEPLREALRSEFILRFLGRG